MNTFIAKFFIEKKFKLSTVSNNNDVFGTKRKVFIGGAKTAKYVQRNEIKKKLCENIKNNILLPIGF